MLSEKIPLNWDTEKWNEYSESYAFELTTKGFSLDQLLKLKDKGINIIEPFNSSEKQSEFKQFAALSDLVIIGEVKDLMTTPDPDDVFGNSIIINVKEVLSGKASAKEIVIRQLSGKILPDKSRLKIYAAELEVKKGEIYLLFLSNRKYRYCLDMPERFGKARENLLENIINNHYVKEHAFLISNDKICPEPERGVNLGLNNTKIILSEIREVGKIIKDIK